MATKRLPSLFPLLTHPSIPHLPRAPLRLPRPHPRPYSSPSSPKRYTFEEIQNLTRSRPRTLLIDVREPSELASTGRIPGSVSMPLTSNPDALYLGAEDFWDRFGFMRPGEAEGEGEEEGAAGHGGADPSADLGGGGRYGGGGGDKVGDGVKEVVLYCKAGVRSRAAARMAAGEGGWKGVKVGEMGGGWDEWVGKGGEVER